MKKQSDFTVSKDRAAYLSAELARVDGAAPAPQSGAKHLKMTASPLQFLRGSAQVFYGDLASETLAVSPDLLQVPLTRIMGDCHVSNFGFFTEDGSFGQTVVFAPNDFDDAAMGHGVWDLLRLLVSVALTADYLNGVRAGRYVDEDAAPQDITADIRAGDVEVAIQAAVKAYAKLCGAAADDPDMRLTAVEAFPKKHVLAAFLTKAKQRSAGDAKFATKSTVGKLTTWTDGGLRFRKDPTRLTPLSPAKDRAVRTAFAPYVDDRILDVVARHGAGTGALNVERYYLLVGPTEDSQAQGLTPNTLALAHVVEVKQQREAALIHHFPTLSPVNKMPPAHLTVDCQRRMARRPDLVLDEVVWRKAHWLVRSRHHARVNVDLCALGQAKKPAKALADYAAACGQALALAHMRGDPRSTAFERGMVKALKSHGTALCEAAQIYSRQVHADHAWLCAQVRQCSGEG